MPLFPPSPSKSPESPEPAPPKSGAVVQEEQAKAGQAAQELKESPLVGQRWLWVGVLAALLGFAAVYMVLQSNRPQVPLASSAQLGVVGQGAATTQAQAEAMPEPEANAKAKTGAEKGGTLHALNLAVPTGFDPPQLSGLSFAAAFAEAAAYRGWNCKGAQVVLFSDARRAIPAVQAELLAQGYKVSDTPAALGEDQSWLARHDTRPTLFGSFSSGPEGRGNISVCTLGF